MATLDPAQGNLRALGAQDFLEAAIESSKRTRFVIIVATIASALVLAGFINSLGHQWMLERIWALSSPDKSYVETKIGPRPDPKYFPPHGSLPNPPNAALNSYDAATTEYSKAYRSFYDAFVKAYVDCLSIKVPIFGFSIDVNDLGMIGGLGFLVILLMYRFSLGSEINNLEIAKDEAHRLGQARQLYLLLAMRQVFTVPQTPCRKRSWFLLWAPKLICLLPLLVQLTMTITDVQSFDVGDSLSKEHNLFTVIGEGLALAGILGLTVGSLQRLRRLDDVWDKWWDPAWGRASG